MAQAINAIDVSDLPDVRRLAEEVRETQEPRVLRSGSEDIAGLVPLPAAGQRPKRALSQDDIETVMSAAGSWQGLIDDVDQLKAELKEARGSNRPPVALWAISSTPTG